MSNIQSYPTETVLSDFISQQSLETDPNMDENISRHLTDDDLQDIPLAYTQIQEAMEKLQAFLPQPEVDKKWIVRT